LAVAIRNMKESRGMKSGLEQIKQRIRHLGRAENGWRVFISGFGDRRQYAGAQPLPDQFPVAAARGATGQLRRDDAFGCHRVRRDPGVIHKIAVGDARLRIVGIARHRVGRIEPPLRA
jgi:hypothetical protein